MRVRIDLSRFLLCVAACVAIAGPPATARAGGVGILVPAYFYPGTGGPGGSGDGWAAMDAAAHKVSLTAIFNPASGPGPVVDPNYVTALTNLENSGGKVVAYIDTNYGAIPSSTVLGEVSTYISQYGSLINGFFFDRMSTDPAEVGYYNTLYTSVKSLSSSYQVFANPGTATNQAYLTTPTADSIVTFENDATLYPGTMPPSWVYDYPASHFTNILYNQPTVAGLMADLTLAVQRNVGEVYVTDEPLNPPTGYLYDRLPSYWDQEVAAIASLPEPGSLTLLAAGALLSLGGFVPWRRQRSTR